MKSGILEKQSLKCAKTTFMHSPTLFLVFFFLNTEFYKFKNYNISRKNGNPRARMTFPTNSTLGRRMTIRKSNQL